MDILNKVKKINQVINRTNGIFYTYKEITEIQDILDPEPELNPRKVVIFLLVLTVILSIVQVLSTI